MDLFSSNHQVIRKVTKLFNELLEIELDSRVEIINEIKKALHEVSPMKNEPVDCVLWIRGDIIGSNDYNPNNVAPPEMELLKHSILEDGYTQPIVTWKNNGNYEVVDGFHRTRIGKECKEIASRIRGFLPIVTANQDRTDRSDRIAATIRHNRARGKHRIDGMSNIVIELKRRNWSDKKIGKELGMDPDEILRLAQITGLAEMFADKDFTESWEAIIDDETIIEEIE